MFRQSTISQKYPQRFEDIYCLASKLSKNGVSLAEVFDQALKFHSLGDSRDEIGKKLEQTSFKSLSPKLNPKDIYPNYDVWLTFGETGQGKSTFVNCITGSEVAEEGKGINSKTEKISLYPSDQHKIVVVDTPGLFATGGVKNRDTAKQIMEVVQETLMLNAHIKAIFFIWAPTSSMKLRFDDILKNLEQTLGQNALNSVVFLINKVSHLWKQDHEELFSQFLDLLNDKGWKNPVITCDVKKMSLDEIEMLKQTTQEVYSFREEDFEVYRKMLCYNEFLETQRIDEEKKRERERIQKEIDDQMKEKFRIQEAEKERLRIQAAEYEERCRRLQEENYRMERRREQEREERRREQEQEERKREEEKKKEEEQIRNREILEDAARRHLAAQRAIEVSHQMIMNSFPF